MYFKVSEIIEVLGFEIQLAPMMAWLRQAEQKGFVKKKICRGCVMFKFRWFKQKKAVAFLEEKYINYKNRG